MTYYNCNVMLHFWLWETLIQNIILLWCRSIIIRRRMNHYFLLVKMAKSGEACAHIYLVLVNVKITIEVSSPPFLCLAASNWAVHECSSMKCNSRVFIILRIPLLQHYYYYYNYHYFSLNMRNCEVIDIGYSSLLPIAQ